ncbi:hypothetical protein Celaphus_00002361, partial [Cervus elaphus hippelaphus]
MSYEKIREQLTRKEDQYEDEAQDLTKTFGQLTSQTQKAQNQHTEALRCAEKTQDHIQKLETEHAIKKQAGKIEQLQKNLLSTSSADDLIAELETASSKCLHLDAKSQVLRQELLSMKVMQKKCEKLEKNKKKLQQEVVNLKSHIEMNMTEHSQAEQYK